VEVRQPLIRRRQPPPRPNERQVHRISRPREGLPHHPPNRPPTHAEQPREFLVTRSTPINQPQQVPLSHRKALHRRLFHLSKVRQGRAPATPPCRCRPIISSIRRSRCTVTERAIAGQIQAKKACLFDSWQPGQVLKIVVYWRFCHLFCYSLNFLGHYRRIFVFCQTKRQEKFVLKQTQICRIEKLGLTGVCCLVNFEWPSISGFG